MGLAEYLVNHLKYPCFRACGTSPHHFGITRSRRYPIQQAQYSCALPTLCRNGHHRKRVLSPSNSSVVQAFDGEDRSSREQPGSFSNLWKRRPSASPFSSPASSSSQTPESPEKKMREEDGPQGSGSSAPPVNKESQGEQDTTTCREQNSWDSPPTPSSSQPRRRKFPLVPSRQGIPLILPRAAWIGCSIKVEEYYQEKQAQSQWLKRIFEDKTATTSDFEAMTQTTSSGGSTTSSQFTSGLSAGCASSRDIGMSVSAPHSSSTTGAFDVVAARSGRTGGMAHFWGFLSQNSLGAAGKSTLFGFYVASIPQNTSLLAD
ncbi:nuclear envelope pore membrane protein POM 121-like [Manis javanica]|uniref:nuclear envelope pore membrane protein POM 121-like n=1 Tax=Manis javanica TaxID=9974 RepID=UPI003C6CD367